MLIHKTKCPISYLDKGEKRGVFFFLGVGGGGGEEGVYIQIMVYAFQRSNLFPACFA